SSPLIYRLIHLHTLARVTLPYRSSFPSSLSSFFFFNDTPTTYISTLSLHDALPIFLFLAIIQTFFLISWFSLLLLQLLRHLFYRHLKLHRQRYILIV